MTQVTPPGWYPDPGQTSEGPRSERWWDGSTWTDQTRAVQEIVEWGPPGNPPGPVGRTRRGTRTVVGALVALAVLAGIGGGIYALTANDGTESGASSAPSSAPTPQNGGDGGDGAPRAPGIPGEPGGPDAPGVPGVPGAPQPGSPGTEDGFATDLASGISLPVPDGWEGMSGASGAQVTTGAYKCPGDPSQSCVRGGAFSQPAAALRLTQSTAQAAAEADIAKNAEDSYGGKVYGKITSHTQLGARAVNVAGGKGYYVRWKVVTDLGGDGYVESLAFPSPIRKDMLVVVRFGFDVSDKAPKMEQMDKITKGIKKASAGTGDGQSV